MIRLLVSISLAVCLAACDQPAEKTVNDPIDDANRALQARFAYTFEMNPRNLQKFSGDVVCGEVQITDKWGKSQGYQAFIYRTGKLRVRPGDDERAIFCSDKPASELQTRLGIGPADDTNQSLVAIKQDITTIAGALDLFAEERRILPANLQELEVEKVSSPELRKAGATPVYLESVPSDPWGNPYVYEKIRTLHPAPPRYALYTLGEDGEEGGTGASADISIDHLQYLDHIYGLPSTPE